MSQTMEQLKRTRNMGIFAHVDAGKTTCTERILFYAGETHKIGDVDDGDTTTDFMDQERERGITICAAAVTCHWAGRTINLIDTPGHVDFTMEVERSMRVLDGGVLVVCAKGGVQPQTRTVWRQANQHRVPRIIFINKMDTLGADFARVVDMIGSELTSEFNAKPVVMQTPIGQGGEFVGVIDLISRQALVWDESDPSGSKFEAREIPAEYSDEVEVRRIELVEAIAETDDELLGRYLEGSDISEDELKGALRKAVVGLQLVPVLCGSAYKKKGVQPLLDAIVDYLPSPLEVPAVKGELPDGSEGKRQTSDDEPLSALVFKVVTDNHGSLYFTRVYSGKIVAGSYVFNSTKGKKERVSRLVKMQGAKRLEVKELSAGDIGVLVGLKLATTGDTLCDSEAPILLESINFPEPVISQAVEPKSRDGSEKLGAALTRLATEDPSFIVHSDSETGQTIIAGQGELHLEIMVERLRREDGVEVNVGKPQVAYRETARGKASGVGHLVRQTGGHGMFAHVVLELEAMPSGSGFVFEDAIVGGTIPREYISSVEKGVRAALQQGPLTGSPVIDVKVRLVDGKHHEVDSSDMAFQIAASMAFKDAFTKAQPVILEPVMKLEVEVPDTFMGGVTGYICQKRGKVQGTESQKGLALVRATVPLSETFGYSTVLRSATQGQGTFTLEFGQYEPVPQILAEEIIAKGK